MDLQDFFEPVGEEMGIFYFSEKVLAFSREAFDERSN
jgi:hypothetical protein